jgi:HEAT repeat protein
MMPRGLTAVLLAAGIWVSAAQAAQQAATATQTELAAAIAELGSFDLDTRTNAARAIRRAPVAATAPELERAVRSHKDEYVRFRALVILAGMNRDVRALIRDVMTDRNDRLRTVAYQWLEHHPEPAMAPALLTALGRERSEFVRPALTRALAAHGADAEVQKALVPLVTRGEDLFRGALIEALGDYRATYAVPAIAEVAKLEGPLQDDAITALGKIGNATVRSTLSALQKSAPAEVQPTISAAFCLLKIDCDRQEAFLKEAWQFALKAQDIDLLRGVSHALGMLAAGGHSWPLTALLDAGVTAQDPERETIALTVGLVALRRPLLLLETLSARPATDGSADVVLDAFDMLSEDFEEERFYIEIRDAFWAAPEGSPRRAAAERMIGTLEF